MTDGETYIVRADTSNPATASDLYLYVECNCSVGEECQSAQGDDDFPCTYAPPDPSSCPEVAIRARSDGECRVSVRADSCRDDEIANYSLSVVRFDGGGQIPLSLTIEDET